jgi:hypothetical protein
VQKYYYYKCLNFVIFSFFKGDGWLWVTAHRTGEQGLVFRDLLTDLDENIDPNAVFPWFHRILTKNEAVERLVQGNFKQLKVYLTSSKSTKNLNNHLTG